MNNARVAAAVFVVRGSKLLLLKRRGSEGEGTWAIPGGKVDFMEDPADAVKRELLEETGLHAKSIEFVCYSNDVHKYANKHFVTMRFVCSEFTGEPEITEPEKCTDIGWFDLDDLPKPLFPPTAKGLSDPNVKRKLEELL